MALQFFDGFDHRLVKRESGVGWTIANPSVISTVQFRTGSASSAPGTGIVCSCAVAASAMKGVGFAWYQAGTAAGKAIAQFRSDAGATIHITITNDASGFVQIRRGDHAGTVIATSASAVLSVAAWLSIEVQCVVDDSAGSVEVRVQGALAVSFSGDTRNGGTSTNIDAVAHRGVGTASNAAFWDDWYIYDETDGTATQGAPNDDWMGDLVAYLSLPNGNGTYSQLVGSDGNSTDNYLLVDENPPNTSDFVGSAVSGNHDSYQMQDLPAAASSVVAVQAGAYVSKSDAGAAGIKTLIRENATDTVSPSYTLSTSWEAMFGVLRCLKPSDSTLWSVADVNATEVGVQVT